MDLMGKITAAIDAAKRTAGKRVSDLVQNPQAFLEQANDQAANYNANVQPTIQDGELTNRPLTPEEIEQKSTDLAMAVAPMGVGTVSNFVGKVSHAGDPLLKVDRAVKSGGIDNAQWLAAHNAEANKFLDAVANKFGNPETAEKMFSRLGLSRKDPLLFRNLEKVNQGITLAADEGSGAARQFNMFRTASPEVAGVKDTFGYTPVGSGDAKGMLKAFADAMGYAPPAAPVVPSTALVPVNPRPNERVVETILQSRGAAPQAEALQLAQQRAALPVEKGGLGLPEGNTPQMRESAMGFDPGFYHGSPNPNITSLKRNLHDETPIMGAAATKDPSYAGYYAGGRNPSPALEEAGTIYPLSIRKGNDPATWFDAPFDNNPGLDSAKDFNKAVNRIADKHDITAIDPLGGGDEVFVLNPDNIRSRFAAFDPWRKTAAIAATMGVAAPDLLAAENDQIIEAIKNRK